MSFFQALEITFLTWRSVISSLVPEVQLKEQGEQCSGFHLTERTRATLQIYRLVFLSFHPNYSLLHELLNKQKCMETSISVTQLSRIGTLFISLSKNMGFSSHDSDQTNIPRKSKHSGFTSRCRSIFPRA